MEKQFGVIVNSSKDGFITVDASGCITFCNEQAEKIIGVNKKDAIGRHVDTVIQNSRMPYVMRTGECEFDWQQKFRDFQILASRMPIKDKYGKVTGAVAVFRDISDITNLDTQLSNLKEYQSMLQAILLSTQDAISVVNEKGEHIMINPAYTNITGIKPEDILGKDAIYDIEEGESLHYKVLKTKQSVANTKLKIKPSGKTVVAQAAPIIVDNVLKGSVAVLHDVTGIRDLTQKLYVAEKKIRELTSKYNFEDIIGSSENLAECKQQAVKAARVSATVLLRGESGTGKELFAHAIHIQSNRRNNQFIRVNCAALSDSLLESELFGYEEGAFTGAKKGGKKGLFEEANKGTIFLDEISEINMNTQVKLLRVLQEKEIVRVGSTKPINIDARVIAATNANLEKSVEEGRFREDLYYRINIFPISLPPLRERRSDIPILIKKFIVKMNDEYGRNISGMSEEAVKILMSYNWPGNVRELENLVGRCIINMNFNEQIIMKEHIPHLEIPNMKENFVCAADADDDSIKLLCEITAKAEAEYIRKVYEQLNKNKTETASQLGISLRSLYYKMEKYNII